MVRVYWADLRIAVAAPEFAPMPPVDPLVRYIVAGSSLVLVLVVVAYVWQRVRSRAELKRRRAEMQRTRGQLEARQQETQRRAAQIITTSSTGEISGFEIIRQVEAVFSDGHKTPGQAVEAIKAIAAQKGANAIANLASERLPTGACSARGDAVIVRPLEIDPPPAKAPRGN